MLLLFILFGSLINNVYSALPLETVDHPYSISSQVYNVSGPLKTGGWWTNLILDSRLQPIAPMPYNIKINSQHQLQLSYPFRVLNDKYITEGFPEVFSFGSFQEHQVIASDEASVHVHFSSVGSSMLAYLVRGSPYITLEMNNVPLQLTSFASVVALKKVKSKNPLTIYKITLTTNQVWLLITSAPIQLTYQTTGAANIQSTTRFTGILRLALLPTPDAEAILIQYANTFPIGVTISIAWKEEDQASIQFAWKSLQMVDQVENSKQLLMLSLPHHREVLQSPKQEQIQYFAMKGPMLGIVGSEWNMIEPLQKVTWNMDISSNAPASLKDDLYQALIKDVKVLPTATTTYTFGKQIARHSRLALIADQFGFTAIRNEAVSNIRNAFLSWIFTSKNPSTSIGGLKEFVYDKTYGGVMTRDALNDKEAEFGAGRYNDHHYHYGYLLYGFAVLIHFDPSFVEDKYNKLYIETLIKDIGTIDSSDPYFPQARHKDMWAGHSWASGLFEMATGKAQESSSEAVNAYYGMALLANVLKDRNLYLHSRTWLAMEIRTAKLYWQMSLPTSKVGLSEMIYEPDFVKANGMIGVVSETQVACSTWFGNDPKFVHGINIIPITPITAELFDSNFVREEYSIIRDGDLSNENDIWTTILEMNKAIILPRDMWGKLKSKSFTAFDDGNSKSNGLYWIAAQSSWNHPVTSSSRPSPFTLAAFQCLGFPKCASAGANGTPLSCCNSLPGCCNTLDPKSSLFGCCHNDAMATQPLKPSSHTCYGQPKCAVAGSGGSMLDCCNTPGGCCPGLGCCIDVPVAFNESEPRSATCHDEPLCATAGANGTALNCCDTAEGCCPGLKCCRHSTYTSAPTKSTAPVKGSEPTHSKSFGWWWIGVPVIVALAMFTAKFNSTVCCPCLSERCQYQPINDENGDTCARNTCCVLLAVVVLALFIYLLFVPPS